MKRFHCRVLLAILGICIKFIAANSPTHDNTQGIVGINRININNRSNDDVIIESTNRVNLLMINPTTVNKLINNSITRTFNRLQYVDRIQKYSVKKITANDEKFNISTLSDIDEQYMKPYLIPISPIYYQMNYNNKSNVISSISTILFTHNIRPKSKNIERSSNDSTNASETSKNTPISFTNQLDTPSSSSPISSIDFVFGDHVIANKKHLLMRMLKIFNRSANKDMPPITSNFANIHMNESQKKNHFIAWMKEKFCIFNPDCVDVNNKDMFKHKFDTNHEANVIYDKSKVNNDESKYKDIKRIQNKLRYPLLSVLHFKWWKSNNEYERGSISLTNMTLENNFSSIFFLTFYIAGAICGLLLVVRFCIWWKRVMKKKKEPVASLSGSLFMSKQYIQHII